MPERGGEKHGEGQVTPQSGEREERSGEQQSQRNVRQQDTICQVKGRPSFGRFWKNNTEKQKMQNAHHKASRKEPQGRTKNASEKHNYQLSTPITVTSILQPRFAI
eukprot:RCo042028